MSSKHYCTFWYPTIFHRDLKTLEETGKTRSVQIEDKSDFKYYLSVALEDSGDLTVTSRIEYPLGGTGNVQKDKFVVTLYRTDNSRNGFVQYYFFDDTIPASFFDHFKKVLERDVYHLAKEFYHTHEADPHKDSALRTKIKTDPDNISENDNEVLIRFLENFESLFVSYAYTVSETNLVAQRVQDKLDLVEKFVASDNPLVSKSAIRELRSIARKSREMLSNRCNSLRRLCENALIEYTYYNTLYGSKYNKSFSHLVQPEIADCSESNDDLRRKALNVENSIRYIQNIRYKNTNRQQDILKSILTEVEDNALKINKLLQQGKSTEIIALSIGAASMIFSILFWVGQFAEPGTLLYRSLMFITAGAIVCFPFFILYRWYRGARKEDNRIQGNRF